VLNGAVGDYLVRSGNPLAIEMGFYAAGEAVALSPGALRQRFPDGGSRLVVLVHGLMANEHLWAFPDGTDYGSRLCVDVGLQPLYVRYNSGRAIADSGAELDALLERLVENWPGTVEEIVLLGFSMGGLVVRAACHAAAARVSSRWLPSVRRAVYVGTPHQGSPIERLGRFVSQVLHAIPDPYTRLIAQVVDLRSRGIQDLGDPMHPVPLLPSISHYLVAGALAQTPELALVFGDVMVPLASATHGHVRDLQSLALPPERVHVVPGTGHNGLLAHEGVYQTIRTWLYDGAARG
jgi:pimeloyl-ACP methyl ester carboxylesterase